MVDIIAVKKFAIDIENLINNEELNCMEAIIKYCKNKDIDVKDVVHLINANPKMKSIIHNYACNFNLIKKTARLDMV